MEPDSLIMWINLLIVVLLLAKFAAKPFMDFFLKSRKKIKPLELSHLETEKEKISGEIEKMMRIINEKKSLLADTKENIIREGEILKIGIIKEAGIESKLILEKAKQEAEKEIKKATEKLRAEVVTEVLDKASGTTKHENTGARSQKSE